MEISIIRGNIHDANQIAKIHVLSWQAIYRGHISDQILDNLSIEKRTDEWRERLKKGVDVWIIKNEKEYVGFSSICPTRDSDNDPKNVAEISAIYLLPDYWGKGFGKQLCNSIFNHTISVGFKEITLWVLETNIQAKKFYESLGFSKTGDIKMDHVGCEKLRVMKYRKVLKEVFSSKIITEKTAVAIKKIIE